MLFVPYSSIIATMFCRMPVRIEAMQIAVITPMTMPSTVRKLRNLWPRTLSSAIPSVSRNIPFGSWSFIVDYVLRGVRQSKNWIEPCGFKRGIDAGDHADECREAERYDDVPDR